MSRRSRLIRRACPTPIAGQADGRSRRSSARSMLSAQANGGRYAIGHRGRVASSHRHRGCRARRVTRRSPNPRAPQGRSGCRCPRSLPSAPSRNLRPRHRGATTAPPGAACASDPKPRFLALVRRKLVSQKDQDVEPAMLGRGTRSSDPTRVAPIRRTVWLVRPVRFANMIVRIRTMEIRCSR